MTKRTLFQADTKLEYTYQALDICSVIATSTITTLAKEFRRNMLSQNFCNFPKADLFYENIQIKSQNSEESGFMKSEYLIMAGRMMKRKKLDGETQFAHLSA